MFGLGGGALQVGWGQRGRSYRSLIRTFDGRMLDFHGNCKYVLARGAISSTDTFAVIIRSVRCFLVLFYHLHQFCSLWDKQCDLFKDCHSKGET